MRLDMKKLLLSTVLLVSYFFASYANASLVLERYGSGATPSTMGGYELTDFSFLEPGLSTSSIASPLGGSLSIEDINGNALALTEDTAHDIGWWLNGESQNYNAYTTDVSWIKIILPENTLAFSFNVGADLGNGRGWLNATDSMGVGLGKEYFDVNRQYTPGFGIYADNSHATAGNCSYVSSVIIDPDYWGVGNFSIAQGSCVTNVPEPSIIALMGLGLLGFGMVKRKRK